MSTKMLYYEDSYLTETEARVLEVNTGPKSQQAKLELNQTIFFPQGGGQPSDQGEVVTDTGNIKVELVRWDGDRIVHEGKLVGSMVKGQLAHLTFKWYRRHRSMRLHSAGHLLNDVLMTVYPDLQVIKANHGDKAFLQYRGELVPTFKYELERMINETAEQDIPIRTWDSSYNEVARLCKAVPSNLPRSKPIRMLQIGDFNPMPDGGVQVRSTKEIGVVVIHNIVNYHGNVTIRYGTEGQPG